MIKRAIIHFLKFCNHTIDFIEFLLELVSKKSFSNPIKQKYHGTVAILANGPSLKEIIPRLTTDEFANIDFSVMNFFALTDVFFKIKPTHYCLLDPMFFKDIRPEYIHDVRRVFDILQHQVDWTINLYIPFPLRRKFIQFSHISNEKIVITGVHCVEYRGYDCFRNFFFKKGLSLPFGGTVAILNILTSINAGYSKIMLYGFDHNFWDYLFVNEKSQLCMNVKHFYDEDTKDKLMLNGEGEVVKISQYMKYVTNIFKSHDYLSAYAKYLNVKIINRTSCSFIDSYDKE
jgi:hypothetical protein